MIRKFVAIKNVGKLISHAAVGDQQLREFNVVYSDNGQGKTMLAAVLDSARSDSPGIVMGRATLGATEGPSIDVQTDGDPIRFDDGSWNRLVPELEVFYSGFVSRAVYAGGAVSVDHKRRLCDFALGPSAVAVLRETDELTESIKGLNKEVAAAEGALRAHMRGPIDVDAFIAIPDSDDVSAALAEARKAVADAKNAAAILNTPVPAAVVAFELDLTELPTALAVGLHAISADAVDRVARHVRERLGADGEQWIASGVGHIGAEDTCPFCDKPTADSELVSAYHQYFGEEYSRFVGELTVSLDSVSAKCDVAALDRLVRAVEQARGQLLAWTKFCDIDAAVLTTSLEPLRGRWTAGADVLRPAIERKRANPILELALNPSEHDAVLTLKACEDELNVHICEVATAIDVVDDYRTRLSSDDPAALQERVDALENRDERAKAETKAAITAVLEARAERSQAVERKDSLKRTLDEKMEDVGGRYAEGINHYLEAFGTELRVVVAERPSYSGGKPSLNYQLELGGVGIPLDGPHDGAGPCFANTLSDGDKNALGLAFFMARLRAMDSVAGITIVFDDPVTSLDETRRQRTIREIVALANRGAQVVVLTHDPGLALALYSAKDIETSPVALCIKREGQTNCIRRWDIEREAASPYIRCFLKLEAFIRGDVSAEDAVHAIRPFIEDNIRHRFPGRFASRHSLGHMLAAISSADADDDLSVLKANYDDLNEINEYVTDFEHGSSGNAAAGKLVGASVTKCAKQAMKVAGLTCA